MSNVEGGLVGKRKRESKRMRELEKRESEDDLNTLCTYTKTA